MDQCGGVAVKAKPKCWRLVLVALPVRIVTLAAIPLAMILRKPKMLAVPVAAHAD